MPQRHPPATRNGSKTSPNGSLSRRRFLGAALATATTALLNGSVQSAHAAKAKKRYPIIYKLNGGTNPAKQVVSVKKGASLSVKQLKTPKRKGYTFKRWFTNKKLTVKASRVYGLKAKKRRRLYAKWVKVHYSISYELNEGAFTKAAKYSYTIETADYTLKTPVKTGYDFAGWYKKETLTGTRQTVLAHGSTGNKVYYAKWEPYTSWERYLEERLPVVQERCAAVAGHGDSLIFITDVHWASNAKNSPQLIERILQATNVQMVVCGGDLIDSHATSLGHVTATTSMQSWMDAMAFAHDKLYCVRGNHDGNDEAANATPSQADRWLSEEEYLGIVFPEGLAGMEALRRTGLMTRMGTPIVEDDGSMGDEGPDQADAADGAGDATIAEPEEGTEDTGEQTDAMDGADGAGTTEPAEGTEGTGADGETGEFTAPSTQRYEPGSYPLCYYVDNTEQKIRYLFLDSGHPSTFVMGSDQIRWLTNNILKLGDGWSVLVTFHQVFNPSVITKGKAKLTNDGNLTTVMSVLDGIYDLCVRQGVSIIGIMGGHCHRDYAITSEKGYPVFTTTCDGYRKAVDWDLDHPLRQLGTIEEQAFDVVHIDTSKRTIQLTRIGIGADRTFTY